MPLLRRPGGVARQLESRAPELQQPAYQGGPLEALYPGLAEPIRKARQQGVTDQAIYQDIQGRIRDALDSGISAIDLNTYLQKPPEAEPGKAFLRDLATSLTLGGAPKLFPALQANRARVEQPSEIAAGTAGELAGSAVPFIGAFEATLPAQALTSLLARRAPQAVQAGVKGLTTAARLHSAAVGTSGAHAGIERGSVEEAKKAALKTAGDPYALLGSASGGLLSAVSALRARPRPGQGPAGAQPTEPTEPGGPPTPEEVAASYRATGLTPPPGTEAPPAPRPTRAPAISVEEFRRQQAARAGAQTSSLPQAMPRVTLEPMREGVSPEEAGRQIARDMSTEELTSLREELRGRVQNESDNPSIGIISDELSRREGQRLGEQTGVLRPEPPEIPFDQRFAVPDEFAVSGPEGAIDVRRFTRSELETLQRTHRSLPEDLATIERELDYRNQHGERSRHGPSGTPPTEPTPT